MSTTTPSTHVERPPKAELRVSARKFPASIRNAPAPLPDLAEKYEKARDEAGAAIRAVRELEQKWPGAQAADDAALADALEKGARDPGPGHAQRLRDELIEATRMAEGRITVAERVFGAFRAGLGEHGEAWRQQLNEAEGEAASGAREASGVFADRVAEVAGVRATRKWLHEALTAKARDRKFPGVGGNQAPKIGPNQVDLKYCLAVVADWLEAPR